MDVALVTCAALPGLHGDDRHLLHALRAAGLDAQPVVWEDAHEDWGAMRLAVVRSAWDYAFRREQFLAWADRAAARTTLWNSARIVRWNTHKRYLCDLAERGVPVVPTVVLPAGSRVSLETLLEERGWEDAVVKAAVAQSGRYAMAVPRARRAAGQAHLDRLLPAEDMLVQPHVASVATTGELSLVFVDGRCTHAVRKRAAAGDFRVHDDYGGSVAPEEPDEAALAVARAAIAAAGEPLHYARVDLVAGAAGEPMIMEFELVEPELFLRFAPQAVAAFARSIEGALSGSGHT
jgi:glutathione synthase/RimK-type ligase-like ATP-grasp enzyme